MCTLSVNALLFFDQTSVTVALPALQREFHASSTELQWTITAYLLSLAVLMVLAGRLADRYGRRRVLLMGIVVFGLGSAACAVAPGLGALIAARFLQGIGGAIMQPLALAHTERAVGDQRRGWAVGLLSAGGTTFLALGPVISGAVLDVASWRWLFVVALPVVAFAWYQGYRWVPPSREPEPEPIEPTALITLFVGLAAVVTGVSQVADWGWTAVVLMAVGAMSLGLFAYRELHSPHPLIPLALLGHNRHLLASLAALFAIQFAVLGTYVYLVLFLQHGLGARALVSGLVIGIAGVFTPLLSISTGRLTDHYGPRPLVIGGLALARAGLVWVAVTSALHALVVLLPGLLAFSLARPAVFTPASTGAFATVAQERRGLASGLVTESRQLGAVFGVAIPGAVLAGAGGTDLADVASLTTGFEAAMLVAAAITAAACVVVWAVLPKRS